DLDQFRWNRSSQFFENRSRLFRWNRSSQFFKNRSRQFPWNRSSQFFENRSRRLLRNQSSQFSSNRSSKALRTMTTTIEQQVALDEALVPGTKRLRIGRSNFRLPSDIQSKEPTLQVATAYVQQHSIRFKVDSKKNIVDLEAFREMLHISPRVPSQSFDELPFEEEILDFLRFFGHSTQIKTLIDVIVNKLFQA
nr:hypothetical protein [Tanacetum cinerariifolium]